MLLPLLSAGYLLATLTCSFCRDCLQTFVPVCSVQSLKSHSLWEWTGHVQVHSSQGSLAWHLRPLMSDLNSPSILCNLEKFFPSLGFRFLTWKTALAVPLQDVCLSCRDEQGWRDQQCLLQPAHKSDKLEQSHYLSNDCNK